LDVGGVGTHLSLLDRMLSRAEYPHIMCYGRKPVDILKSAVLCNSARWLFPQLHVPIRQESFVQGMIRVLVKAIRGTSCKPDLVHCHDTFSTLAAKYVREAEGLDIQIVQTTHAPLLDEYLINHPDNHYLHDMAMSWDFHGYNASSRVIAVDTLQKELVRRIHDRVPVTVIPNAVDLAELADIRTKCIKTPERPYICVARHLSRKNGIPVAVEAYRRCKSAERYQLVVVGDGQDRPIVEKLIVEHKLEKKVLLMGKRSRNETLQMIANASVSLIPSIPIHNYVEATSLTMLESLGLGCPIVASSIGGLQEVLEGTEAGLLVPPNEPQALADAIDGVLSDGQLRERMRNRGMELAREYDTNAWFLRHREIYESL